MRILHIGNEETKIPITGLDWLSEIITASSMSEAFNQKESGCSLFDLILISEEIWLESPAEVILKLKRGFLKEDGCIIAILENETSEKVEQLYCAGANDYLVKPITESKLLFRLNRISSGKTDLDREEELLKAIRQLEKTNERLKSLTDLDSLTGIFNRRYFHTYISKKWDNPKKNHNRIFIMMADIDAFKAFNDTYGHVKGDQCLKQVAECMKDLSQKLNGITARYGGEEFIVVIENHDEKKVVQLAEEIRSEVEKLNIPCESGEKAKVTISIGVAGGCKDEITAYKELIDEADQALYLAKDLGGNRVMNEKAKANA
ncbi:diguanylate cyclase [Metabacillus sp. KIGAM252]|uniref:Diguanylate cyclase n=1 Tax=Metabacillus flavus TaxID=2823519 RepID=A0ABS5LCM6_9BACI|nr:diguanylate cyclase [Metabacillus flavus]MBS2968467.1 diguanylate cyclase [Metabacillus flavus]